MTHDDLQLQILRLMRDATAAGVIGWEPSGTDKDTWYTTTGPIQSFIRFKWPSYNYEVSSDRDFVEVDAAGRFMIGTPGWTLAVEILGAGLEEWGHHVTQLREQYERQIRLLTAALEEATAESDAADGTTNVKPRLRDDG